MTTAAEHVERVNRSLESIARRDVDGFMDCWAGDVVWQVAGDNPLSGVYRGGEEVRKVVRGFMDAVGDEFRLEPVDVLADDQHVAIFFHATGERGGKRIDMTSTTFIRCDHQGRWHYCWWVPSDQRAYDDYFS